MSRKAAEFASIITQPLNVYNFEVRFVTNNPLLKVNDNILLTVQSASFPEEKLREMVQYYKGERIVYAAKPDVGGNWTITLPEGDGGQVRKELDKLKHYIYDQKTGAMTPMSWFDIEVFQKDLQENIVFAVVLKDCWLKGRGAQDLKTENVTDSWKNSYEFHYSWIEDNPNAEGAPNNQKSPNPSTGA